MTADGHYVEAEMRAPSCGELSPAWVARVTPRVCSLAVGHDGMHCADDGTEWIERRPNPEWQERHADLAATLRTVLAICGYAERRAERDGTEPATLYAYVIRAAIEEVAW